ncbi:hypothetical protein E1258_29435 [Micromonospora sp. KC207]|uniref:hypothetical protein n=1 Tax=Micromonospora sp. KC207 TaxID=2530377 RepID=UPI0010468E8E|nr:hypothetical protein [Micromonospora sp. KC207]TDC46452.1 hypothetical protein E1258_29435 [Micromonospora sp. KC207]
MIDAQQRAATLVVDAARSAVTRYAPEELEVFDGVVAGWQERTARSSRRPGTPGSAVGFGIDAALVSELFLQAASAAVSEVLVLGATGIGAGLRARWVRHRSRGAAAADPMDPAAESTGPAAEPTDRAAGPTDLAGEPTQPTDGSPEPADEPTDPADDTGRPAASVPADAPRSAGEVDGGTGAGSEASVHTGRVDGLGLTKPQVAELRQACRRHALALGLPPEAADLLADALVGAIAVPGDR